MLSIEEIKLLIDKLKNIKKVDLQELIDSNLKILTDLELAVDANNEDEIDRLDKTLDWFREDLKRKREKPIVNPMLFATIKSKIGHFSKTSIYNCLEIGPGTGMFSKEFRAWRLNYFLEVLPELEETIRRRFNPFHQKYLKFYYTRKTECSKIPQHSCNLVFSWDTFPFFTQNHIQHYLHDIKRVLMPGGYCFIHYADCHFDFDLREAKRKYWNYNTKTAMKKIIEDEGYEVIEMAQFKPGANYFICKKPGKQNPTVYKISEITID
jgi:ubiquinone/menaquinone biosynthesis C-methylase UbiE